MMNRRYPDLIEGLIIQHAGLNKWEWMVEHKNENFLFVVRKNIDKTITDRRYKGRRRILMIFK